MAVVVSPKDYVKNLTEKWRKNPEAFSGGEVLNMLMYLDEDIYDSSISCEKKKEALKLLWENKDMLEEFEFELKDAPKSHWWWHPELWDKDIDIYKVLKYVCTEDDPSSSEIKRIDNLIEDTEQSIEVILTTSKGAKIWEPEFRCDLLNYIDKIPINAIVY